jgi:hypothetical protein
MKKIENKLLCLEFLNSKGFDNKIINSLVGRIFLIAGKNSWLCGNKYRKNKVSWIFSRRIRIRQEDLKKLQESMISLLRNFINFPNNPDFLNFINYKIPEYKQKLEILKLGTRTDFLGKKWVWRAKRRFGLVFKHTVRGPVGPQYDIINDIIEPLLFIDLAQIEENGYRNRVKNCFECDIFFITKTQRQQLFCSDKCRFYYHNSKKIKSGNHRNYMKEWRAKNKNRYMNTQI